MFNRKLVSFRRYVSGWVAIHGPYISNPHFNKEDALAEVKDIIEGDADPLIVGLDTNENPWGD